MSEGRHFAGEYDEIEAILREAMEHNNIQGFLYKKNLV